MSTADEVRKRADESVHAFIERMRKAGNPGAGRHEIGLHHINGWILEYDPAIGGCEVQAVLDLDGVIHARRETRSQRARAWSPAEWVSRDGAGEDPMAAATEFADRLERLYDFETRDVDDAWGLGEH